MKWNWIETLDDTNLHMWMLIEKALFLFILEEIVIVHEWNIAVWDTEERNNNRIITTFIIESSPRKSNQKK